jgi:L-lysine exporter family protein LysE/ArgO
MFILLGLVVGFVAAIPLGPVNIFVISQTIKHDFLHGFLAGLTTALLDFLYCSIALVGFFHISFNLNRVFPYLKIVAAAVLIYIAIRLVKQAQLPLADKSLQKSPASHRSVLGVILLYVSNPGMYFFWLAIGGSMTAHNLIRNTGWRPFVFALACGLGSLIWYSILVRYVSIHHHLLAAQVVKKILQVLAFVLFAFAIYTIMSAAGVRSIPFLARGDSPNAGLPDLSRFLDHAKQARFIHLHEAALQVEPAGQAAEFLWTDGCGLEPVLADDDAPACPLVIDFSEQPSRRLALKPLQPLLPEFF